MNTPKFNHLSLVDALALTAPVHGWVTQVEHELYEHARDIVWRHAEALHIQHQLTQLEERAKDLAEEAKQ